VAERFSSADLLHGPIAMLDQSFPAFLFCPSGVTWEPMRELYNKLLSIDAETVILTDQSTASRMNELPDRRQQPLVIPTVLSHRHDELPEDLYTPVPYVIPAQLFAASLAEVKRLDPDRPRSLNKVTQNL